jgi:hypothetical protein
MFLLSGSCRLFPVISRPGAESVLTLRAIPGAIHAVVVGVDAHQVQDG